MNQIKEKYKNCFNNKCYLISFLSSFILISIAMVVNFYAGTYATEKASNSVTDIILSNIRVYDVDGFFIYGSFILVLFITIISLCEPKKIPFVIKSISLFIIIRSVFISLTHLGPFPSQILIQSDILSKMSFGGDLFFSGHTGLPFLLSLIFWENKILRYILISFSLMFAVIVLLAHLHYSIDVLAAFFITYSIFHISMFIFKKDLNRSL